MARLEVQWSGDEQSGVADVLIGLGLREVEPGFFVAEGEGRTLVRVLGPIRDLERRVRDAGDYSALIVKFRGRASDTA